MSYVLKKKYNLGKSDIIEHNDIDDSFLDFHNVISEVNDHFAQLQMFRKFFKYAKKSGFKRKKNTDHRRWTQVMIRDIQKPEGEV